jgi:hypothetical protein
MMPELAADAMTPSGQRRRLLSIGAGLVAASAWLGAVGLATGADPYLRHLTDRLPLRSPVLGAAALSAIVGVPYTVLAVQAWRGSPRVDQIAIVSGGLMMGWILIEALVLDESSFLEPLYAAVGLGTAAAGYRWLSRLFGKP